MSKFLTLFEYYLLAWDIFFFYGRQQPIQSDPREIPQKWKFEQKSHATLKLFRRNLRNRAFWDASIGVIEETNPIGRRWSLKEPTEIEKFEKELTSLNKK